MHTQLEETGDDVFLDLSCHARLLHSTHRRRMRVGIEWERAVLGRGLVGADAFANGMVMGAQALQCSLSGFRRQDTCIADALTYGEEEFADHMPVDTAQTLVLVESA